MEEEIFRDVPGFEGIYEASSLGYVRKVGGYKSRLKPHNYGSRKVIVSLYKDKRQYSFNIGDLIAGAFLGKKPDGYEIYYKNGNPADAKLSNICYSNLSEIEFNSLDRNDWRWVVGYEGLYAVSRQERINEKNGKHIMVLSRSGDIVGEFRSMEDASRSIGLYRGAVGKILRGDRRNTTNYLFRYKDGNLQKTN